MEPYQIKTLSYIVGPIVMVILFFLYISSPVYSGYHIHTFEEHGAVFIRRDSFSIPTIKGSKMNDAYFGLGYAHCQDRQWSMEVLRKTARGRLSEIFGKETLRVDQLVRELGISDVQETDVNEEVLESLQSYSRGVNQCYRNKMARSFELIMHSVSSEEWTELDSLAIFKLISISFSAAKHQLNFNQFLPIEELAQFYGENVYQAYNRTNSFDTTNQTVDYLSELQQLFGENSAFAELTRESFMEGWIINGNYTNTSKPIVVNNLNSQASAPTLWYNSHLIYQTPAAGNVTNSGASIPGFPAIFSGLNDNLSWGLVNIESDSLSVSPLTLSKDGESYLFNGNWQPITVRNEKILVKNSEPIMHVVRETESGIILGGTKGDKNSYLQLLWKGSNINNSKINPKRQDWSHSISSIQNLMEARDLNDISELFKAKQTLISIGLLVGTNDNHIAFINTSLNVHQASSEKYLIHVQKERGQRIQELLNNIIDSKLKISTEQASNIMTDLLDVSAEQVLPKLLGLYTQHQQKFKQVANRTTDMMKQLEGWDSSFTKNSIPASVFSSVILSISKKLFYTWNQKQNNRESFQSSSSLDEFIFSEINRWSIGQDLDAPWCDHPAIVAVSGSKCLDLLFSAVDDAKNLLTKQGGEKVNEWQWGKLHIQINEHREFMKMPLLRKWFKLKEPAGGNKRTVFYSPEDATFFSRKSTSYRSIISLDRQDKSYFLIDTGIQESYLSSQYSDQMKHFSGKDKNQQLEVQYSLDNLIEIKRDLNKLRENNIDTLLLVYDAKNDPKKMESTVDKKSTKDTNIKQQEQSQDINQGQLGDI